MGNMGCHGKSVALPHHSFSRVMPAGYGSPSPVPKLCWGSHELPPPEARGENQGPIPELPLWSEPRLGTCSCMWGAGGLQPQEGQGCRCRTRTPIRPVQGL